MNTTPGVRVIVHEPVGGKPLRATLPVETMHVGWVTVPIKGCNGRASGALIVTLPEAIEVHPPEVVTMKL